jgi:hypothetical protein
MTEGKKTRSGVMAKEAYGIYRGMIVDPALAIPHWDDLTRQQQGLLEWTVRFARFSGSDANGETGNKGE